MAEVLVTGAGGFVGSHAVERARARGLDVATTEGDLRDPAVAAAAVAAARPSAVLHLAAGPRSGPDAWELLQDELRMAANVFRAVSSHAPGAVVLVPGSAGQYGLASAEPLSEDAPSEPVSPYAAMKCVLERACLSAPLRGAARAIWACTFNIVGPGQGLDAPVPSWAKQTREGRVVRTGNLDNVRDFLDVRDVADAYLDLVATGYEGRVNVGSGVGVLLRDVLNALLAAAGGDFEHVEEPGLRRAVDPPVVVADIARLRSLTSWAPRYTLDDSLRDLLSGATWTR